MVLRPCLYTTGVHPALGDIGQGYCMSTIMVDDKSAVPHHNRLSMDPNTV